MNEKELRKLGRGDLMQLILDLTQENETLRARLEAAQEKLRDRELRMSQAGSLAEAALKLSGVFEAADAACRLYTENYQRLTREMIRAACRQESEDAGGLSLGMDESDETKETV